MLTTAETDATRYGASGARASCAREGRGEGRPYGVRRYGYASSSRVRERGTASWTRSSFLCYLLPAREIHTRARAVQLRSNERGSDELTNSAFHRTNRIGLVKTLCKSRGRARPRAMRRESARPGRGPHHGLAPPHGSQRQAGTSRGVAPTSPPERGAKRYTVQVPGHDPASALTHARGGQSRSRLPARELHARSDEPDEWQGLDEDERMEKHGQTSRSCGPACSPCASLEVTVQVVPTDRVPAPGTGNARRS